MSKSLYEQARGAKSAEELISLAKTAGIDLGEENAKQLFAQLNRSGELSDDELNNVAGGGCKSSSGRTVVTSGCNCFTGCFKPIYRDKGWRDANDVVRDDNLSIRFFWYLNSAHETCGSCRYLEFEGGTGVCGKS